MARRPRDYAAEYARRKEIHKGDIQKARGHGSRAQERVERKAREVFKLAGLQGEHKPSEVKELAREYGTREVEKALDNQKRAMWAYYRGDTELARRIWEQRNPDLPEWMFFYHGAFGV